MGENSTLSQYLRERHRQPMFTYKLTPMFLVCMVLSPLQSFPEACSRERFTQTQKLHKIDGYTSRVHSPLINVRKDNEFFPAFLQIFSNVIVEDYGIFLCNW
jgi:hypothetical protein